MIKLNFQVEESLEIKDFLKKHNFSSKLISYYLHHQDLIKVNGDVLNSFYFHNGDNIEITLASEESNINIIDGTLNIVYEDEYLLILNKPHNIAVSGTSYHYNYHLSGIIYKYFLEQNIKSTVHFVNRLDYETSGLIVIAKHKYIHHLFSLTDINKRYYCLVSGILEEKSGLINKPIAKVENDARKREISPLGKESLTKYEVIKEVSNYSLLEVTLLTGRTHQIRLHMSSIGHPLVGDALYGNTIKSNILLQSYHLDFIHPITHKKIDISLELDEDIYKFINNLENN